MVDPEHNDEQVLEDQQDKAYNETLDHLKQQAEALVQLVETAISANSNTPGGNAQVRMKTLYGIEDTAGLLKERAHESASLQALIC